MPEALGGPVYRNYPLSPNFISTNQIIFPLTKPQNAIF